RPSQEGESKNPDSNEAMGVLRRGRPFSLVRFFWASKRNELGRASGRNALLLKNNSEDQNGSQLAPG
ncbi:hypothetical protein, partial [Luteimonas aquatica]|uniref:hypothetical protein n=1 Tax=Luteimonas aquatica TaxID=450364 RepID=UPI001F55C235